MTKTKNIIYSIICLALLSTSCKKNRICECKNANNSYDAGEYEGTKMQAKKYCKDLTDGSTECYLKD